MLSKPICIICSTFCYMQMSEYHCQGKGLAYFLKWPHKEAFVVWVTLIKTPISEFFQMQKSEFAVQEDMSLFMTQTYIIHIHQNDVLKPACQFINMCTCLALQNLQLLPKECTLLIPWLWQPERFKLSAPTGLQQRKKVLFFF